MKHKKQEKKQVHSPLLKSPLLNKIRNWQFLYCFLGFLLPLLGMGITILIRAAVMKAQVPSTVFSMLHSDAYHQYFPFFKAYREALRNGENLLFSWDVGLGMDYTGLIAYYLGSPLNLLSVLLPDSWIINYFTFLNPLRLGLAGMFFAMMLCKIFGKNDISISLFGSFYATCAWALGYMWNSMWVDTFALLPLVFLGTISLLKERKFLLYTVSLFLAVVINYYIGFFVCIFTLLTFIGYQICRWRNFRRFAVDLGLMALFTVIAIGMTAFLTLPAYAQLQTTSSSVNEFPEAWDINNYLPSKETVKELNQKATELMGSWFPKLKSGTEEYQKKYNSLSTALQLFNGMKQSATNTFALTEANYSASEGLPNIACGVFSVVFLVLMLTTKQVKWRDRICCVVLFLFMNASFILRRLDYIWHGFHFPNMIPYRFSFLYSFAMLLAAYRGWTLRRRIRSWQVIVSIAVAAGLLCLSTVYTDSKALLSEKWPVISEALKNWSGSQSLAVFKDNFEMPMLYGIVNFTFLLVYLAVLLIGTIRIPPKTHGKAKMRWQQKRQWYIGRCKRRRLSGALLVCVLCVELVLNLGYFGTYMSTVNLSSYPRGTENTERIIKIMKELEEDNLFFRAETTHTQTYNDGALNGYNGITTFSSSANSSVTTFMSALGYGAAPNWNRYAFEESSPVSNLFLGLKYMIERQGKLKINPYFTDIHHSGNVHLLENNYYLPLGFLTDPALAELSFADVGNRFTFQDELLSAATGHNTKAWTMLGSSNRFISSTDGVTLSNQSDAAPESCSYKAGSGGGSVFYTFTFDREGFFCTYYNMPKRNNITVSYDDGTGYKTLYTESYSIPFMMSVCQVKPGDKVQITLKCKANESGSLKVWGALLDEYVVRDAHETLSQSTLNLTTFENTLVEGTIDCHKDGLLYTSIPHCGNWEVYVDGQKAEVTLIGDAMTGVMLTEGSHTVTFRYRNAAVTTGCIVSVCCAALLGVICWYQYGYLKKQKGKYGQKA